MQSINSRITSDNIIKTLAADITQYVTSWITSDGNETLQRFANFQLDCETPVKDSEQEFEKFYFISMKHLAKGRDLHEAAEKMEALHDSAMNLKVALDCFADKLEQARERIEGATRLHQLLNQNLRDENVEQELQRLMEHIGVPGLLEKYHIYKQQQEHQQQQNTATISENISRVKPNSLNLNCSRRRTKTYSLFLTSTPAAQKQANFANHRISSGIGSFEGTPCECWRESRNLGDMDELLDGDDDCEDGEEEQSKIADSGLGGCERCEGNTKLARICSCQSLHEVSNFCDKSHNDDLDDDCYERPPKPYFDIHSPVEANAHLQCFASNLELPKMEEHSCLDQKIQKTLLLIIREMIGTERDYVRSLYYVIENYVDELLRDDIPQPLRGQRNVIFGNIEKIFEFHNSHFLSELERYERNPLKVGAAFLEMESKFYLYALYNKNKPKSDTLMSEYGTTFFKTKQFELTDKMDLASYLLKPVQRMGKYALLLQQLVKACSAVEGTALQDIAADVEELQRAEEMVKFQLRHGNDLLAMDSLRDCDVNVKEQGRLLRQNEFLVWQGRGGKKTLRHIFLFEDLVLFSKARRFPDHKNLDIYLYKNSIKTSDIGLTAHVGDSPTKFEIWFRKRKPEDTWTLQCMSEDIKNAWTEEISKLLWKQAKRNREIRLAEMSSMGIGSKPCLDIRPSNNQISDRSITLTQLGKAPKLRHSFASSTGSDHNKARRPNSLISDCSMSSGTSSSSISTGSSS
ncbi:pleckstrin homology domain-containing family G member 4B-like, partial [Teleopsis dalmanni]|uniref:pleckstrin homology domain-containing family G member 4B-like n=1 Tax=Teleopsis dalmanni TaxID=139649 RepID=UPI0018CF69CA